MNRSVLGLMAVLAWSLVACGGGSKTDGTASPAPTTTTSAMPMPTTSGSTSMPPPDTSSNPPPTPQPSTDATLSDLEPSVGALVPAFSSTKKTYALRVPSGTTAVVLTPTATNAKATIAINAATVSSGKASNALTLPGDGSAFTVNVVVTAEDGTTTLTYALKVLPQPVAAGVTVHSIGDSTMASYDPTVDLNQRGWMQMFPEFADDTLIVDNAAINGTSSKSFYLSGSWDLVKNRIAPGDFVFIQFAHNDEKDNGIEGASGIGTAAFGAYTDYLTKYVTEARALGAIPILFTPVVRIDWNGTQISAIGQHDLTGNGTAVGDANYPEAMRDVAMKTSTPLVDLTVATKATAEEFGPTDAKALLYIAADNTHLQVLGATVYATLAVQGLRALSDSSLAPLQPLLHAQFGFEPSSAALDFGDRYLGSSIDRAVSVLGVGLAPDSGDAAVTAPSGFLVSTDGTSFAPSATLAYRYGTLPPTTLYVRDTAGASVDFADGLSIATTGANSSTIQLTGSTLALPPGGVEATATYALDSTTTAGCVASGGITCSDEQLVGLKVQDYAQLTALLPVPTPTTVQRLDLVDTTDTWPTETAANPARYVEFVVQPSDGKSLAVDTVSFNAGITGTTLAFAAAYSTNADFSGSQPFANAANFTANALSFSSVSPDVVLAPGQALHVRIFPYSTAAAIKKYLGVQGVTVHGVVY